MDQARTQLIERIKQANNVLVAVSANPSVDQLAAAIGLTLMLHKLDKHATAVFSGEVPSTIEFLQPEETLEKNTDSLRDFIISLDRSKADKLRYKVEDKVVKIFITPYRTSISEKDLEFSQGDFNVDVVVAIGVAEQADLDSAITSQGRILHDATVATISTATVSTLGSINWQVATASSLSELITSLATDLGKDMLDAQIATALLTGIVAETDRFSNDKTSPQTMNISAQLMSAGANQQLVATKLEPPPPELPPPAPAAPEAPPEPPAGPAITTKPKSEDGTLEIPHDEDKLSEPPDELADKQIHISDKGELHYLKGEQGKPGEATTSSSSSPAPSPPTGSAPDGTAAGSAGSRMMVQPPTFSGPLTSGVSPGAANPSTDGLSLPTLTPDTMPHSNEPASSNPALPANPTLSQLEETARSEPPNQTPPNLDALRAQIHREASAEPQPLAAPGAQSAMDNLNVSPINTGPPLPQPFDTISPQSPPDPEDLPTLNMPLPSGPAPSSGNLAPPPTTPNGSAAPPVVPPPIL